MKAAGYVRVSTEDQVKEGLNLEEDRQRIREKCEAAEWELTDIFDDGGLQGDDPDRPGLLAMLASLDDLDVVVIRSVERLSRSPGLWELIAASFVAADTLLVSFLTGPVDLETPQGEFIAGMFAQMGRFEKRITGQRVKQARAARLREGKVPGGSAPYGYRWQDKGLVEVPAQADIVRRIFRDTAAGVSQRALVRSFDAEGILTAPWRSTPAKPWTQSGIRRVLKQSLYAGLLPNGEQAAHEPLVDLDLWHRVQSIREGTRKRKPGRHPAGRHLLTKGLLRCSGGAAMLTEKARPGPKGSRERYVCSGRKEHGSCTCAQRGFRRELVDEPFLASLLDSYIDMDATVKRIEQRQSESFGAAQDSAAQAEHEAATAEAKLARVRGDYQAGKIEADDWREQRPALTAELDAAREAAQRAKAHADQLQREGVPDAEQALLDHLTALKQAVAAGVDQAPDLAALRIVIAEMFESVEMVPDVDGDGFLLMPQPRVERLPDGRWDFGQSQPLPVDDDLWRHQPRPTPQPGSRLRSAGPRTSGSARRRRC